MIRTIRKILRAVIGSQLLDDDQLETFFFEAESIVNGRPLTRITDGPSDLELLTTARLLFPRKGPGVIHGKFVKEDVYNKR